MKNVFLLLIATTFFTLRSSAQSSCANPTIINLCPDVYLTNETNLGMGDDNPMWCNQTGEDKVYKINVPTTNGRLFVSMVNASGPYYITYLNTGCSSGSCNPISCPAGNRNMIFNITSGTNYIWIDAPTTITYDIAFGADTTLTYINIPNTLGNLNFDPNCTANYFKPSLPFFEVNYNGSFQTQPMTLSPLGVSGHMCVAIYFMNTTGDEGVKKIDFEFGPDLTAIAGGGNIPGSFNNGTWIESNTGQKWTYSFSDAAGVGRGDFDGSPNSCLKYEFCFDLVPLSNNIPTTNVNVTIRGDGFGTAFTGWVGSGCCPSPFPTCHGTPSGGGGGGSSFGFGFNDPGGSLPIELLEFKATVADNLVHLNWATASETNNDFFTVERSINANEWEPISKIKGAGNSTVIHYYESIDETPIRMQQYYRLKQTDFNGLFTYSDIVAATPSMKKQLHIYPNPSHGKLTISNLKEEEIFFTNSFGEILNLTYTKEEDRTVFNTHQLQPGIYFIVIKNKDNVMQERVVVY